MSVRDPPELIASRTDEASSTSMRHWCILCFARPQRKLCFKLHWALWGLVLYCFVLTGFVPLLLFFTNDFHIQDGDLLEGLAISQYERVTLMSRDPLSMELEIAAVYYPRQLPGDCPREWLDVRADRNKNATVIAQHGLTGSALGNTGGASIPRMAVKPFLCAGFNVLTPDLRNHGHSADSPPISSGYNEANDILVAAEWLADVKHASRDHIFLWGESLGAATVAHAAARDSRFRALAIEAPPVSCGMVYGGFAAGWPGWLRWWFAWWHKTLSLEDPYNENLLRQAHHITADVFHSHGYEDKIVPFWNAQLLSEALKGRPPVFDVRAGAVRMPRYTSFFHHGGHTSSWNFDNYTLQMLDFFNAAVDTHTNFLASAIFV